MELTLQQQRVFEQIIAFMESDAAVFILRGYAGTGKTTMVKIIADFLKEKCCIDMMAPTGRAARILSAKTGFNATTIHRCIYENQAIVVKTKQDIADIEFKFVYPVRKRSEFDKQVVAIVDEASMVCSRKMEHELFVFGTDNLMEDLLTYVRPAFGGKIIFIGDPAQLPPIGENISNALKAEYFTERNLKVCETELTEVLRQKGESTILKNAFMIRDLLEKKQRNNLAFIEKEGEVESIEAGNFLNKYIEDRKSSNNHDSVVICFSNKSATKYNRDIRSALYGADCPIRVGDVILITKNNYHINRMNGEFAPILSVGRRHSITAPVYCQIGSEKKRVHFTINFVEVCVLSGENLPINCMLIEDLLTSDSADISIDENRALFINFCIQNPNLKQGTKEFANALREDRFYNAIRGKYGYAVTGHKCQGGEWKKVFVDYTGRTGLDEDSLRWNYTATTRAKETLYFSNLPHITPFSKFRIDPIQKCKSVDGECRIISEVGLTPFHTIETQNHLRAKYNCIVENLKYTNYSVHSVISKPYLETYNIQTPNGIDRFDLHYNGGGVFSPAKPTVRNEHTQLLLIMLNNENALPIEFNYQPSDELRRRLYYTIRSACDSLSIQLTNVVEHNEDFSVMFYFKTCNVFSYLKVYINSKGFVTYAKPMSMLGAEDNELMSLIETIENHLI